MSCAARPAEFADHVRKGEVGLDGVGHSAGLTRSGAFLPVFFVCSPTSELGRMPQSSALVRFRSGQYWPVYRVGATNIS